MAGVARITGGHIINRAKKEVDLKDKRYKHKIVALYFSAHWCAPCRAFTPILSEIYKEFHDVKNFKIIFISQDEDEKSFHNYYKDMPWLALDYRQREKREELMKKYNITGIPKLILLDGDTGKLICDNAIEQILHLDPEGVHFPWRSRR